MATHLSETVYQIRHSGVRTQLSLAQIDQILESKQLLKRMNEAAVRNEQANPHEWWKPAAGHRDTTRGASSDTQFVQRKAPAVHEINTDARVITSASDLPEPEFVSCLQIRSGQHWATVVCYEYRRGHARRYVYYPNGEIKPFEMDLPPSIIAEMSVEDFKRNWAAYTREFNRGLCSPQPGG